MQEIDTSAVTAPTQTQRPPVVEMTLEDVIRHAQALQRHDQLAAAEELYQQILAQMPDEPNSLNFLGVLRHQQQRSDEAVALLQRAVERVPDEPGPWLNLGNVLLEQDRYAEAARALERALGLDASAAAVFNNLGVAFTRCSRLDDAEEAFRRGLALEPDRIDLHHNYARMLFLAGRSRDAVAHSIHALDLEPTQPESRQLLTIAYHALGDHQKAAENLLAWRELDPSNPQIPHLLAVIGAADMPARASDEYVEHVFDGFAKCFDRRLEMLGYRAPQLCADLLAAVAGRLRGAPVILDAGCGTGLCAALLRPFAERLVGVDLSSRMLERARARDLYDVLEHAELTAWLKASPQAFDAIVSADTLCYFGALEGFMAAARHALRSGGILVFSLEAMPDDSRDYTLHIHGRYSHSRHYVERVLASHRMRLDTIRSDVLRMEMGEPVNGWLVCASRDD